MEKELWEKMKNLLPIKTERLLLKETSREDVDLLLKMDQQETTQKFLGGIKNKTREERIEFLKKKEKNWEEGHISSLTAYLFDQTPIGFIGIRIKDEKTAILSYIFDADYTNHGYCTEAARKLLEISFQELNLERVESDFVEGNLPSKRVLEKLGFQYKEEQTKEETKFIIYKKDKE